MLRYIGLTILLTSLIHEGQGSSLIAQDQPQDAAPALIQDKATDLLPAPRQGTAVQPQKAMLFALDLSEDGQTIVVGGDALRVVDFETGEVKQQLKIEASTPHLASRAVQFLPGQPDHFVSVSDDSIVRIWQLGLDSPVREMTGHTGKILDMAISPDGEMIASCSVIYENGKPALSQVMFWNTSDGSLMAPFEFVEFGVKGISFSQDGQRVAYAKNSSVNRPSSGQIDIYEVGTWKLVRSIPFSPGFGISTRFTKDGTGLLIAGGECVPTGRGGCRPTGRFWLGSIDGDQPAQLIDTPKESYFREVSLSPNGEQFATGTSAIQIRKALSGELVRSVRCQSSDVYGATFSNDGKFVLACDDDQIWIIEAHTGTLVRKIECPRSLEAAEVP